MKSLLEVFFDSYLLYWPGRAYLTKLCLLNTGPTENSLGAILCVTWGFSGLVWFVCGVISYRVDEHLKLHGHTLAWSAYWILLCVWTWNFILWLIYEHSLKPILRSNRSFTVIILDAELIDLPFQCSIAFNHWSLHWISPHPIYNTEPLPSKSGCCLSMSEARLTPHPSGKDRSVPDETTFVSLGDIFFSLFWLRLKTICKIISISGK